jgi:bacillithiol biosynthesis cysteine-adding enzyme BshC|nr:MAG: putative cysteine ligase BshC [Bacteroidota bacterium]
MQEHTSPALSEAFCSWDQIPSGTLFRHYVSGAEDLRLLWPGPHYQDWRRGGFAPPGRSACAEAGAVSEVLRRQVRRLGGDEQAERAARLLAEPGALAIVTGQQAGLLGGPLYTFYKILTALELGRELASRHPDRPVVVVFWLEGEDHDLREINRVAWPADGELEEAALEGWDERPLAMWARRLPEAITPWLEALFRRLPAGSEVVRRWVEEAYRPGTSVPEAFARLLYRVFSGTGLLVLDPTDPELKGLLGEVFFRALVQWPRWLHELQKQSERLHQAGYKPQIRPQGLFLFWVEPDGERRALDPDPDGRLRWRGGARTWSHAELLQLSRSQPERFSPGVALRPIVQDWLLPTAAYVAGPAEVAYWAQVLALYPCFGLDPPVLWPRLSATLLDTAALRLMERLGLRFGELFAPEEELLAHVLARRFPLSAPFPEVRTELEAALERLRAPIAELDPSLEGTWGRVRARILEAFEDLEVRTYRAQKRRHGELHHALRRLRVRVAPEGKMQERIWSALYGWLRWGEEWLRQQLEPRALNPEVHHLLPVP